MIKFEEVPENVLVSLKVGGKIAFGRFKFILLFASGVISDPLTLTP